MSEIFNPKDFASFDDLPEDKKPEFKSVEGGFVRKEAAEKWDKAKEFIRSDVEKAELDLSEDDVKRIATDMLRHYSFSEHLFEENEEFSSLFPFKISSKEDYIELYNRWAKMDPETFKILFESTIEKMQKKHGKPNNEELKSLKEGVRRILNDLAGDFDRKGLRYVAINNIRPSADFIE